MPEPMLERAPLPEAEPERPLKICLLGYRSNPYSGGQGIYLKYLSKALVDAGHSVDVISGEPYPHLDERVRLIKLPGLNLYEVPNHVTALRPRHLKSYTDTFEYFSMLTGGFPEPYTFGRRLVKYFRKHKPDYDIVHDNQSLCYGTLALQQMCIPLVTTIHHPITSDLDIALKHAPNWKHRLLVRRWHSFLGMQKAVVPGLNHIVTVSEASRQDIAKAFGIGEDKIHIVHNGIATDLFRPMPDTHRKPNRIMATASADAPLKGLAYLLNALVDIRKQVPEAELLVVGKLKEDGDTRKLIDKLDLWDHVTFRSDLTPQEIVDLYAEASVAVVPSIYEGFGLPAGEAMASGVPVVSTDGGALPEVVGDAGKIVPVRDSDALSRAIVDLLKSPDDRKTLGEAGRARIVESFSWEVAARDMVSLYRNVMAEADVATHH